MKGYVMGGFHPDGWDDIMTCGNFDLAGLAADSGFVWC
jgi:hypothetical protein